MAMMPAPRALIHFFYLSSDIFAGLCLITYFLLLFPLVTEIEVIATAQMFSFGRIYLLISYASSCTNNWAFLLHQNV